MDMIVALSSLPFDLFPRLAFVRKRDAKQLAGADIFHAFETKRADRMLDRFPLRVENGRLELDDDGGMHGREFYAVRRHCEPPERRRLLISAIVPEHHQHRQECLCHTGAAGRACESMAEPCGTDTLVCALARCSV